MPNVLDIRRRIRSVKNTQQITRAMKMVSAAKLRRAQENMLNARPYANRVLSVIKRLVGSSEEKIHPLLAERKEEKIQLVVFTVDKGLCGAFNTNIIKSTEAFLNKNQGKSLSLYCVGKKGRDYFAKRAIPIKEELVNLFNRIDYDQAQKIGANLISQFKSQEIDAIYLLYNEFKSVIQQRIVVERLLPIPTFEPEARDSIVDYIYEQSPVDILASLIPKHIEVQIFRALLESSAAEHGARMTAMDAATNNAIEMIDSLTLTMNRARQAGITNEIIEVVSGAAALK